MLRKIKIMLLALALLTGCTTLKNQPSPEQTLPFSQSAAAVAVSEGLGTVQIIGGNETTLRQFIQRWFAPLYGTPGDGNTVIHIGQLPDNGAIQFPLPDQAVIIASIQDPNSELQILLDVALSSEQALSSYTRLLTEAQWTPAPEINQGSGFVSSTDNWLVFCNQATQAALNIQVFQTSGQSTEMRINLYTQNATYMCDPSSQNIDQAYAMIPTLKTPTGALVTSGGTSSGDGNAESSSEIRTTLSPLELSDHFARQISMEGWQQLDFGDADNFSWRSWTTMDDRGNRWQGLLIVLDNPVDQDLVYALMRVTQEK